jgi:two-component system cell cycle sensor histidine kinase/response regulator CckA
LTDGIRILIVEDEAGVRRFFQRILSEDGYLVTGAGTGGHARLLLRETGFDAAVVDMSLPDEDGPDLIRHMRSDYPFLAILACSGNMAGSMRKLAIAAGATALFEKPISARKLQEAVYAVLDPSHSWLSNSL